VRVSSSLFCGPISLWSETKGDGDREGAIEVKGRGKLQLAVLIENMRREGFELGVLPPKVLFKEEEGKLLKPQEEVKIDLSAKLSGIVIERFGSQPPLLQILPGTSTS